MTTNQSKKEGLFVNGKFERSITNFENENIDTFERLIFNFE